MQKKSRLSRLVMPGLSGLVVLGAGVSLFTALSAVPTSGVTFNDSPPAVPCASVPCTYDSANYSSARYSGNINLTGTELGDAIALGDFNNDGIQDVAIGGPKYSSGRGLVQVIYGTAGGPSGSVDLAGTAIVSFYGKAATTAQLGLSLGAGDVTGDGIADLVVGAPGVGNVYVLPGSTTKWTSQTGSGGIESHSGVLTLSIASGASSEFGSSVAVGDIGNATGTSTTTDGKVDIIVGAPGASNKGAAYLVYGPITASNSTLGSAANVFTFNGGANGDRAGDTVAIFPSVTEVASANGIPDIGIGAPSANSTGGKLYLIEGRARDYFVQGYSGATSGSLDTAIYRKRIIVGDLTESANLIGGLGFAISGIGDVNNDDINDFAVGAPYAPSPTTNTNAGRVYVFFGSSTVLDAGAGPVNLSTLSVPYFYGETNYDQLGSAILAMNNLDGDIYDDFLVAARRLDITTAGNDYGGVYTIAGRSTGNWGFSSKKVDGFRFQNPRAADASPNGAATTSLTYKGIGIAGGHDLDSDGYSDFFVGSPGSDVSSTNGQGRVYYVSYGDFLDRDTDGQDRASGDCDDASNVRRYRADGSGEVCDGKDNDCDGLVDDADASLVGTAYYADGDGDGYGNKNGTAVQACSAPSGKVADNTDCDDTNANIKPGATEICDSKDNDCDGLTDDSDSSVTGRTTWYKDTDNDGFGSSSSTTVACTKPTGYSASSTDCNDNNAAVNPSAQEICDSIDNDCDVLVDDQDPSVTGQTTYYFDADGDTYGLSSSTTKTCSSTAPTNYTTRGGDCADLDPTINPGATETCDGKDNDCDSKTDIADSPVTGTSNYYPDSDKDTYGSASATAEAACPNSPPSGKVTNNSDCDDTKAAVNPVAQEICNSIDDDCDTKIDDSDSSISGQATWYQDADSDTFGNASKSTKACSKPTGYVSDKTDCDDTNANIKPTAQEVCDNGVDNDCDGQLDDNDPSIYDGQISVTKLNTYYQDSDGDGYGKDATTTQKCSLPNGYSTQKGDCNDGNNSIYPGAPEGTVPNSTLGCIEGNTIDNDCDEIVDEGTCDKDDDGDLQSEQEGDCNDANPTIYTGATEVCNGVDEDCDGKSDEDYDVDNDGQLDQSKCTGVSLPNATDCDDKDPTVKLGAPVACDGKDTDCDGTFPDTGYTSEADADKDEFRVCAGDCNDGDPVIFPNAPELCDSKDNNCNNTTDEVIDDDKDGFTQCDDCDDTDNKTYPGANELCDGEDNNCDKVVPNTGDLSELDSDSDGYRVCESDCDDGDEDIFPGNTEVCDEKDNDCNDKVDDDATDVDPFYEDGDADGYGNPQTQTEACNAPIGYVINDEDCDDADASTYAGAEQQCDGVDHDCDGEKDYLVADFDADDDSYLSGTRCSNLPSDYKLDCDDSDKRVYPGAEEVPGDGIDNDCDGQLSEGSTVEALTSGCSCSTPTGQNSNPPRLPASYGLLAAGALYLMRRRAKGSDGRPRA